MRNQGKILKQCRNQGYDGAPNMESEKGLLVLY